ncbi:20739_t:CDS:2 [Funneliformis geosporum]|uniref:9766_t:CDS:1 n=1 Tax=Funneliformis geosporum TaxID=1117311 RepID=A0A9W4WNW6_9GLOM|nr:20739_t:CDS:2 [Funneliformis geosporum]CAI2175540.1 9766_t:CDS:2 [Funneliformis geosporum]
MGIFFTPIHPKNDEFFAGNTLSTRSRQRRLSYDRNQYNREMFNKAYTLPTPIITTEPMTTKELTRSTSSSSSISAPVLNYHYFDEPYSYTGLSSPKLNPICSESLISRSKNEQKYRDLGKEITDNFLFKDSWPQEIVGITHHEKVESRKIPNNI